MDEDEYTYFVCNVFSDLLGIEEEFDSGYRGCVPDPFESAIVEQLRDENGLRVDGCYRMIKVEVQG